MPDPDEVWWDELGVSWRASIPDAGLVSAKLRSRLAVQSGLIATATIAGGLIGLLGLGLAGWTLWISMSGHAWNFVVRGATIAIVSLMALVAAFAVRASDRRDATSLREMLDASISCAERLVRAADLGCLAVVLLAVGGTVGYALRIRAGRPPAVSLVEDLLALAIVGLVLLGFRWSQARALSKQRYLARAIAGSEGDSL